jgi:hypothetical protein
MRQRGGDHMPRLCSHQLGRPVPQLQGRHADGRQVCWVRPNHLDEAGWYRAGGSPERQKACSSTMAPEEHLRAPQKAACADRWPQPTFGAALNTAASAPSSVTKSSGRAAGGAGAAPPYGTRAMAGLRGLCTAGGVEGRAGACPFSSLQGSSTPAGVAPRTPAVRSELCNHWHAPPPPRRQGHIHPSVSSLAGTLMLSLCTPATPSLPLCAVTATVLRLSTRAAACAEPTCPACLGS